MGITSDQPEEELYFVAQLPHTYKPGTNIRPHVHWTPTNTDTGSVVWGLEYTWQDIDETYGNTTIATATDAADGTAYKQQIVGFGDVTGTGMKESSMLVCRVFRDATSGADTYNTDSVLLELDFHFEVNKMGTQDEIPPR